MPLGINGYNDAFKAFADFAAQATKGSTIAQVGGEKNTVAGTGPLAGRTIVAKTGFDFIGNVGRRQASRDVNNEVRELFKQAIADMFGGPDKIPESVRDAMKLSDFDKGKPLTARRIIAVKNAIDKDGIMKQKGFDESISSFKSPDTEKAALDKGYSKNELPRLAKAVNLLVQTTDCSEAEALDQVATQGSKANRLMKYGGRFLQSPENFKNGLRLLDSFSTWFDETTAKLTEIDKTNDENQKYTDDMSKTLLNGSTSVFDARCKVPTERFAFEELANNPAINLAETDPNKLFGLENNQAMGAIGRNLQASRSQTFAQVPPEKRTTFFKALNTIYPIYASTAREALVPPSSRGVLRRRQLEVPVARILKNLDQIEALDAKGKLTAANLVKLCFPEIPKPGRNPTADVAQLVTQWEADMDVGGGTNKYAPEYIDGMNVAMNSTGCSIEDALLIAKGEKKLPTVPYFASGSLEFHQMDGTPDAARAQLEGDLHRIQNYTKVGSKEGLLKNDAGFRFNLPGGESILTNGSAEGKANIPKVIEKLEALCGKVHPGQASSLMMMTCQSGLVILRGGLEPYGISSSEHSPVDFTISKDETTGDISIHYTSPKGLPFSFDWTATIKTDGSVSTSPLRFADAQTLEKERADLANAIRGSRVIKSLPPEKQNAVVDIFLKHAGSDRDLVALLTMHEGFAAFDIAVNGESHIRSEEKIAKSLAYLKANIDELRIAVNGDQRAFDMGLKQLASLGGKGLKPGIIAQMAQLATKEDVASLKGVNASSSPDRIFEKMCNFDRMVNNIVVNTKVLQSFDGDPASIDSPGATEAASAIGMAQAFLLARCDNETLQGLRDAMHSVNTRKMMQALDQIGNGAFPPGSSIDPQVRIVMSEQVAPTMHQELRMHMTDIVNDALGIKEEGLGAQEPKEYEAADAKSFAKIVNLLEEHTTQVFSSRIELDNANPLRQRN